MAKPAARQGDATAKGGPIIQGSSGVFIGSITGIACSACPGGMAVGNPVNPLLGAKVLSGETDIALPGPLPFILSRSYSSYQTATPAPVGLLGPGWQLPAELSLRIDPDEVILNDQSGRSIHFESFNLGEIIFSRSESIWLARGGIEQLSEGKRLARLWLAIPKELRLSPHYYFATNDPMGPWWLLGYTIPYVPDNTDVLPQPLPNRRTLQGLVDRFGRTLRYQRAVEGPFKEAITHVIDGAGRHYQFTLQQVTPISKKSGWGTDSGIRLTAVHLTHDPLYPKLPEQPLVRYEYNERGELTTVYDRTDQPIRHFVYHPQLIGRIIAHQALGQPQSRYKYDAQGRVIEQLNPDGLDYRFNYQTDHAVVTDSLGRTDVYHFAGKGSARRLVKHQRADGSVLQSKYNSYGHLEEQIDALGRKTEFKLDIATSNLIGILHPDGSKTSLSYNKQCQLLQTTLGDNNRIRQNYDELGRLIEQRNPQGEITRYHYPDEHTDLPDSITEPNGATRTLSWTAYGQLASYRDCSDNITHYHYNRWGELTKIEQPAGLTTVNHYDPRGRLTMTENAAGEQTTYRYNSAGQLIQQTAPDGSTERLRYDSWGRPTQILYGEFSQQFHYDLAGRLIRLINENGAETLFNYDAMDRLIEETGFDGRIQRFNYNAAGELIESDDMGLVRHWQYDVMGRLVERTSLPAPGSTGDKQLFAYDERGQLQHIQQQTAGELVVSVLFQRDKVGRLLSEIQQVATDEGELRWHYQVQHEYQQGQLSQTQYADLPPIRWQRYGAGHLLGVAVGTEPLVEFTRDSLHRETHRQFGRYSLDVNYDKAGRLNQQQVNQQYNHPLSRLHHYNTLGQLTRIELPLEQQHHYQYDNVGRLIATQTPDFAQLYDFDPAGNRLLPLAEQQATAPQLDNRLHEDSQYRYQYDPYGNLIVKQHRRAEEYHHYYYDAQHRLIHYSKQQGSNHITHTRYLYDPLGRRLHKQTSYHDRQGRELRPTAHTWYGWDGDRLVMTERDNRQCYTIYSPDSFVPLLRLEGDIPPPVVSLAEKMSQQAEMIFPDIVVQRMHQLERELRQQQLSEESLSWLAMANLTPERLATQLDPLPSLPENVHIYHCDHLGTPLALLDRRGKIGWQVTRDPWGNIVRENNLEHLEQPIGMQGQHYDTESGLYYNRHRYYDPWQGKYITQDPVGLRGGINNYQYVLNPTKRVDPLGLAACEVAFPDYPIEYAKGKTSTWLGGHSGILTYNEKGFTQYYEYGRYEPSNVFVIGVPLSKDDGNVRRVGIPNLQMGEDGKPTNTSMNSLKEALSSNLGKGTKVVLTCNENAEETKISAYAEGIANDGNRAKYNWNPFSSNHCRSFARDAYTKGKR